MKISSFFQYAMSKIWQASTNDHRLRQEMLRQVAECLPRSTLNSWPVESRLMSKAPTVSFVTASMTYSLYSGIATTKHVPNSKENTHRQMKISLLPVLTNSTLFYLLRPVIFAHYPLIHVHHMWFSCSHVSGTTCSRGDDWGTAASGSRRPKQSFSRSASHFWQLGNKQSNIKTILLRFLGWLKF